MKMLAWLGLRIDAGIIPVTALFITAAALTCGSWSCDP